jgi:hypothetical protein
MASEFAITGSATKVTGKGEITFTVTNTTDHPIRGRADLVSEENSKPPNCSIDGPPYRDFVVNGTHQFTVRVDPPADAPPGTHTAWLRMVDDEHTDEVCVDGPPFTCEVLPRDEQKFPIWIPIVVAAVVLLAGAGVAAFVLLRGPVVPDVRGLTLEQAKEKLEAANYVLGVTANEISDMPPNTVIAQEPDVNARREEGTEVHLVLAIPSPPASPIPVPDTRGRTLAEAQSLIQAAGLQVGSVTESGTFSQPVGRVVNTVPGATAGVAPNTVISFILAKEPPLFSAGEITLTQNASADLDQGTVVNDSNSDIQFKIDSPTQRFIAPRSNTKLLRTGANATGAAGCAAASLNTSPIAVTQLQAGAHFCVLTTGGRLSDVRVVTAAGPAPSNIRLAFTTYEKKKTIATDAIQNTAIKNICVVQGC